MADGLPPTPRWFVEAYATLLPRAVGILPEHWTREDFQAAADIGWRALMAKGELVHEGMAGSRMRTFRLVVDEDWPRYEDVRR